MIKHFGYLMLFFPLPAFSCARVYPNPIVTQIARYKIFYKAEDYHQDYYANNKNQPYCQLVIQPELTKFRKVFKDKLK